MNDEEAARLLAAAEEKAWFVAEAAAGLHGLPITPFMREVLDIGICAGIAGALNAVNQRLDHPPAA